MVHAMTGFPALPLAILAAGGDSGARISFDFRTAEAMIDVLGGKATADAAALADLPGNVRMIEHQRRFDPAATARG